MGIACSSSVCRSCPACPCCGFATKAFVHHEIREILKNWLTRLEMIAPKTKLRELSLLTSHDCGTYSIPTSTIGSSISRTQSIDVYEQLDLGVRSIDFRYGPVGKNPQDLAVRHGPHSGGNYFHELIKVKQWLEDNPYEFLIIDAKCEKRVSCEQRDFLMHFVRDKFGKHMITRKDTETWFNIETVTLGELRNYHPKRLLFLIDYMILEDNKEEYLGNDGFLNKEKFLVSNWHNTGSPAKLFDKISKDLENSHNYPEKFVNLQLILSPKIHGKAIARYCFCLDSTRIDQKQYLLFQERKVQYFIRSMADRQLNFVMMDFVNYDPHITNFLIGLNFPHKLTILNGFVIYKDQNINVTDRLKKLVSKRNSLWLVRFAIDLGLKIPRGELHIFYEYDNMKPTHKHINLKREDQFLLNIISHLDVTLEDAKTQAEMMDEYDKRRQEVFHDLDEDLIDIIPTNFNHQGYNRLPDHRHSTPRTKSSRDIRDRSSDEMCSPPNMIMPPHSEKSRKPAPIQHPLIPPPRGGMLEPSSPLSPHQ